MTISTTKKATIDDVAALAGVSIKTVSRVINEEPNVRKETRDRVKVAIERLNYRPNFSARRLAAKRSYIVALLYDNPSANYLFNIQSGVLAACGEHRYDLLVHPCDSRSPGLADEIMDLRDQGRCDGVVLTPPLSDIRSVTRALVERGTPFVQIAPSQRREDYPWVATTDESAGFEITQHLIKLGHKRIAYIQGHPDHEAMATREDGYRRALRESGLAVDKRLVVEGYNSFESGEDAARRLLGRKPRPTAIFAANDDMAAGVLRVARDLGLEVPGKLSVVGFDDTPVAAQTWPALTTIHQPIREMAESAAKILIHRLDSPERNQTKEIIDSRLVVRQSTGPAPSGQA